MWKRTGKFKNGKKGSECLGVVNGDNRMGIYENELCGNCHKPYGVHYGNGNCPKTDGERYRKSSLTLTKNALAQKDWKCGDCGKMYSVGDFVKLAKVKAVKNDPNPTKNYGYCPKCTCGYVFGKDNWQKVTKVPILVKGSCPEPFKAVIRVSSVFLELHHNGGWYETMCFVDKWDNPVKVNHDLHEENGIRQALEVNYQYRNETKKDAIREHNKVVEMLKKDNFNTVTKTFQLRIYRGGGVWK